MGCRPIVLGPGQVRILREPSQGAALEHGRARPRDGKGRFAVTIPDSAATPDARLAGYAGCS